jgi:hypothetical protein
MPCVSRGGGVPAECGSHVSEADRPGQAAVADTLNFLFQSAVGIQTSKRFAGAMTPLTRQIGRAMSPTGDEFGPLERLD